MVFYKYITKQIVVPSLVAAVCLNTLFLLVQVLKIGEIAFRSGMSIVDLLWVSVLFLPYFTVFTIPVALLMGILLGFGRMAEDGELLALASSGISPVRLAVVPVLLGLLVGLLTAVLSAGVAPRAVSHLADVFANLARENIVASLRPGSFFQDTRRITLYPHQAGNQSNAFHGFMIYDYSPGHIAHAVFAKRATVEPDSTRNLIHLNLEDGAIHAPDEARHQYSVIGFETAQVHIDIDNLVKHQAGLVPELDRLSLAALASVAADPEISRKERSRYLLTWHQKLAFPAACVVFGLLGTCLGATGRLKSRRSTLVAAMLVVASYYILMRFGDNLVNRDALRPAFVAWAPNVLISVAVLVWMFCWGRRPR
jgi:lipopolysaccharide export system permease protein